MSVDNSGFGLIITLIASNTFPFGSIITQYSDDVDPFDIPSLQIADKAMGLNGDLITWSKANPIIVSLSVIAGTLSDAQLAILLEANRVGAGKNGANDVITLTGLYPSGNIIQFTKGIITDGMPGSAIASSGRLKTKTYSFAFENKIGVA